MATFSTNAVRQVIVAKAAADVDVIDVATGAAVTSGTAANVEKFYIKYKNIDGEVMHSDIVDKGRVRNYAAKSFEAASPRTITIKVNKAELTPNTEYSLRVMIREVMSGSQEDQMTGLVSVVTSSSADPDVLSKEVCDGLANELNKMYGAEFLVNGVARSSFRYNKLNWPVLQAAGATTVGDITGVADTITIQEIANDLKPWIIGKVQLREYNFDIYPNPVISITSTGNTNFESFDWLLTSATGWSADPGMYTKTVGGSLGRGNGKVAADLEYFYHGDLGDFYREVGYPMNITTKYMVDPTKQYDTIDLAFFYRGEATSPQASEKQLLILCEGTGADGALGAIALKLDGLLKVILA